MQSSSRLRWFRSGYSREAVGWQGAWLGMTGLLALFSFSWLPNSYLLMVGWPYCLWWQAAFVLLVGWGVWMSRQFARPLSLLGHHLDWIASIFAVGGGLSVVTAQFRTVAGLNFLLFISYGLVLYISVNWLRQSPNLVKKLWSALVITGTLTNVISIAFWRPTLAMWTSQNFYAAIRNPWPLGHHNFVGGYCLLLLPLVVGLTLTQVGKWCWIGYGAIALNAIALYISGSRGALLGVTALGMLCLVFFLANYHLPAYKKWMIAGLLCSLLIGIFFSNPRVRSLASQFPTTSRQISIEHIADGPTKDRLFMLKAGQNIFRDHPVLGVGPGNLSRIYARYRPIEAGSGLELVQQLHNTPAQVLAELGIVGFSAYLLWIGALLKIGISLHRKIIAKEKVEEAAEKSDRILLYSIGSSWFAYSISSLTDYQLENIGITTTLVITAALLIALADQYLVNDCAPPISHHYRRLIGLFLLLYLSLTIQAWARVDASFYLASAADRDIQNYRFADADTEWEKASLLMPSDPTFAALSAQQLVTLAKQSTTLANRKTLIEEAIDSLKAAVKASPNDAWLNQNLAVLLLETQPDQARQYLHHVVALLPRGQYATYYTLGHAYLNQNQPAQASIAFTLESLANPSFLTDPIWKQPLLSEYLPAVLDQTLAIWQSILARIPPDSIQYRWLNRQIILTKWWFRQSVSTDEIKSLRPEHQAVVELSSTAGQDTQKRLAVLTEVLSSQDITSAEQVSRLSLLRAWVDPEQYLSDVLEEGSLTKAEKQLLIKDIQTHQNLREWLISINSPKADKVRHGLAFAYRNRFANDITQILSADGLSDSYLLDQLNLFSAPPREFSQLDREIADLSDRELAIHPFSNG
ncbi:O-antigen ligase family protein [cf. Phormidesmis sp. LEGE 11477]|uniref:O-antigen ligase family protein n=1 Tax=cf. Phormidesmis sp. LEGE 11477 TaxID=1828680 RepID=UPI001882A2AE|nr:O-antigen ligase family protein [cf. Phormidesmis sp. LEGE 11477]MBE9063602.1 O-antigen ligase family protein [cf. Phormidesmis sp. LEGE 11477]